jgi:flagellar biosynthetic protein FlhB
MSGGSEDEDKTHDPTQKKLDDAIKKGDVAKFQELSTFLALGALTLALLLASSGVGRGVVWDLRGFLLNAHQVPDGAGPMLATGRRALWIGLSAMAVPVGIVLLAALAGGLAQHRPLLTTDPLKPKFSRLSPMAGVKRMFGREALVQFVKGVLKIVIVGTLAGAVLWNERDRLEAFVSMGPATALSATLGLGVKMLAAIVALHAVVAIADTLYQRMSWMKRLRMTDHDVKQEMKEQEGNPEIKARLRQLRSERLRSRMMAAVPTATVIVANPTHFAVALKYEAGMAAPICVAKGVDTLALRIREVGTENAVPVIENPPLARALHASVEIDAEIPVEHYKAVAEVIGFVLRLKRRAS